MNSSFQELLSSICELQEIDLALHALKKTLDALPAKLAGAEAAYHVVKSEYDMAKAELSEVEKGKRADESSLADSVEHLRAREAKLYAIKTNKEYQAALKEISEGKRQNREREDRVLQAMEKIEALSKKIAQLEQDCADKESAFREQQAVVQREEAQIRNTMQVDEVRRPEVAGCVDKATLRKYEIVRQRYARAIAGVVDGICQGCSRRIPPQLFNEILRRNDLKSCPSCQRLLYVMEQKATEAEGPAPKAAAE